MIRYIIRGQPIPRHVLLFELVAIAIALLVTAPFAWWVTDRTPPQVRLYGTMDPATVERGGYSRVRYVTTKRLRPDCEGTVQQEIVDSGNNIYSKLARAVGPLFWQPDPDAPEERDVFYGHPVQIPEGAQLGPATFRTVTFRYCNWLQKLLHWPIVQVGPDIKFMIVDRQSLIDPRTQW